MFLLCILSTLFSMVLAQVQNQTCEQVNPGSQTAAFGTVCSWMNDCLAQDAGSTSTYLQCQPINPGQLCGRWIRQECPGGTSFSVNDQVCVLPTDNISSSPPTKCHFVPVGQGTQAATGGSSSGTGYQATNQVYHQPSTNQEAHAGTQQAYQGQPQQGSYAQPQAGAQQGYQAPTQGSYGQSSTGHQQQTAYAQHSGGFSQNSGSYQTPSQGAIVQPTAQQAQTSQPVYGGSQQGSYGGQQAYQQPSFGQGQGRAHGAEQGSYAQPQASQQPFSGAQQGSYGQTAQNQPYGQTSGLGTSQGGQPQSGSYIHPSYEQPQTSYGQVQASSLGSTYVDQQQTQQCCVCPGK